MSDAAPSDNESEFQKILTAARAGSKESLGRLFEMVRGFLDNLAERELDTHLNGKIGASDVVQKSFIEAMAAFTQFQGQLEHEWKDWLAQILRNNVHDEHKYFGGTKKRAVHREVPMPEAKSDDALSPSAVAMRNERLEALQKAMNQLDPKQREVIRLRQQENMTFAQIGTIFGISEDGARKCWGGAVDELRELIKGSHVSSI